MVKIHVIGEEVEAVVDTGASASVVGTHLACQLGECNRVRKVQVRQGDRSLWRGNFVVKIILNVMDSCSVLEKFRIDAEVLDIENRSVILTLSW